MGTLAKNRLNDFLKDLYGDILLSFREKCICDALRDLVTYVQFIKHEKHPWRKPATLLVITLLLEYFSHFLT